MWVCGGVPPQPPPPPPNTHTPTHPQSCPPQIDRTSRSCEPFSSSTFGPRTAASRLACETGTGGLDLRLAVAAGRCHGSKPGTIDE